ncbi:hypothetical protein LLG10_05615 [bacterium]|nr:hypothetical protein [bacterium]
MRKTFLSLFLLTFLFSFLSMPAPTNAALPDLQISTNESGFLLFGSPGQRTIKMVDSSGILFKEINIPSEIKQNSRFQICPCGGFIVMYDATQGKFFYLNDMTEESEESYPVTGTVSDITVSKNRSRYVGIAKGSSKIVTLYDEARKFIRDLSLSQTIQEATLIQLDRDNKLWVYDKKSAAIFKFDTKGELLQTIKRFGSNNIPELVSFDSDIHNMLYVMDKNGTTYNINSRGENLSKTQWNKPGAGSMAYDAVHKQMFIATASIFCGNAITKQKVWEITKPWQAPLKKIFEMRIGSRMFTQYGANAKTMDAAPYIDVFSNRTMVPLRTIAEAVGCQVNWIAKEQRIELSKTGLKVTLVINKKTAQVNGKTVQLDAVPVIQKSRTFVPLRFVGETFSFQVEWKEVERKIRLIG